MAEKKEKVKKREIRKKRGREKRLGKAERPRLSIFRSRKHIYCQLIDDSSHRTIISVSDFELKDDEKKLPKTKRAEKLGQLIAQKALAKGIKKVIFDKSGYAYHGIVKNIAQGAREAGLIF